MVKVFDVSMVNCQQVIEFSKESLYGKGGLWDPAQYNLPAPVYHFPFSMAIQVR
jgi:hypothetical protein